MKTGLRALGLVLCAFWMGCADFEEAKQAFCARNPERCPAIQAHITLEPSVAASCVLVEVRDPASHGVLSKKWLPRTGDALETTIPRGALPADVELAARPYQGNCLGGAEAQTPNGVYVTVNASFTEDTLAQATLNLQPGTDADNDHYVDVASGGADCNDASGAVNPGISEACTDRVDLNCDGKKGCEATGCPATACIEPPTALVLTLPTTPVPAGTCTAGTVQVKDASGALTRAITDTAVSLQANPAAGIAFFSDLNCTAAVNSVSISATEGSASFFIMGQVAGAVTVTASASGLTQASQNVQVTPGPGNRLVFTSPARTVVAGACSQVVQIQSQDAQGNAAPVSVATMISLGAPPSAGFQFFTNATCTGTAVASVAMDAGTSSSSFYFKATKAGSASITVTATGFTGSSQSQAINPASPAAIIFTGPLTVQAGDCSTSVTVTLQDAFGNPTTATGNTTISLAASGKPLSFSTNNCSTTSATSVAIAQGVGSATFSFKGTQAGTSTITGTSSGLTNATLNVTINAAPPSVLVFSTGPQTLTAGACSAVTTVQLQDSFGNVATVSANTTLALTAAPPDGFQFFVTPGCGGAPITGVSMLTGSTSASFYFQGVRSGAVAVTATVNALSKTQTETINPGAPSLLVLSTATQPVTAGACTLITLQVQDNNGNASPISGNQVVTLTGSTGVTFFSNSGCTTGVGTVTVNSGQSAATFYAKATKSGSVTVTATKAGLNDGSLSLAVNPAAPSKVVFLTAQQSTNVGACSGSTTVDLQDAFSNSSPVSSGATVNLSGSTGNITFYSNSGCTNAITSVVVANNQSSASFYFKDSEEESVTITAASTGLASGTQQETINPLAPTMLAFTTPERSAVAGTCSGVLTVETQAAGNISTTVTTNTTVSLSTSAPSGVTFYSNSGCTTVVTQLTIFTGQGSANFYFKGTAAAVGTFTITASSSGLTSATQNATVTPTPTKLVFTNPARTPVAGVCSPIVTVQSADGSNNPAPVAASTTVNLTQSGTPSDLNFKFYSDAGCGTAVTSVVISAGQSTASFYFKGEKARTVTLTAAATGLTSATQDQTITPANASVLAFSFSTPPQTQLAGTCALRTVESRDAFGNLATNGVTFTPSGSTTAEFFSDSGCTAPISQVSIAAGNSSGSFYFKGYTGGINVNATLTLTAASTGLTSATQAETITPTVRTGTCAMTGSGKTITCGTIAPALSNTNKALLVFQATTQNTSSAQANVRCRVSSTTQVACDRGAGGGSDVNIRWAVAEFPGSVAAQYLSPTCSGDTTSVPISNVVSTESFLLLGSERNVADQGSSVPRLAELTATNQVQIRKTATTGCGAGDTNDLEVFDYPGASVQRGLSSMSSGTASTQVDLAPSVALDRSIVLYSYIHDSTTMKICDRLVRAELTNGGSKVTFTRGDGDLSGNCTGSNINSISYEVVQFPVGTVVQQVTRQLGGGVTSMPIPLTTVDASRTIVIAGGQWASGQVHGEGSYSGGSVISEGRAQASVSADGTTLTLARETSNASASFTAYVVQFKP